MLVRQPAPSNVNTAGPIRTGPATIADKLADVVGTIMGGGSASVGPVVSSGGGSAAKVSDILADQANETPATSPSTGPDKILIGAVIVAALAAGYLIFRKKGK